MIGFVVTDSRGVLFGLIGIHRLVVLKIRHVACHIDGSSGMSVVAVRFLVLITRKPPDFCNFKIDHSIALDSLDILIILGMTLNCPH